MKFLDSAFTLRCGSIKLDTWKNFMLRVKNGVNGGSN